MYIDKSADIVNKYNNTYYNAIKMKPANVKFETYIDFNVEKKMMKILNLQFLIILIIILIICNNIENIFVKSYT